MELKKQTMERRRGFQSKGKEEESLLSVGAQGGSSPLVLWMPGGMWRVRSWGLIMQCLDHVCKGKEWGVLGKDGGGFGLI